MTLDYLRIKVLVQYYDRSDPTYRLLTTLWAGRSYL
jgi:hypothetical protein